MTRRYLSAALCSVALTLAGCSDPEPQTCTPNCEGKTCGDDGCGGVCGQCTDTQTCNASGVCECTPIDCAGRECGANGCNGFCGTDAQGKCPTGKTCSTLGKCVSTCQPNSCSGHGTCADSTGAVVCTCAEGYTGAACSECAAGYQDNDTEGT